ncbi:MAG: type II toxin-antitoxin system VapC family toxin [Peptococcaceae bacterium]|jgi:PIN domain nuclease of toxin-antitoxin system|nr:type II toxin-antitoxin system VapC family toxin [Peptococcaceae bacterium]
MRVLLDTHVFLWWITDDRRLSPKARDLIGDGSNDLFLSAASGWEIAIKAGLGKLKLPADVGTMVAEQLDVNAISALPVQMNHALHVNTLPAYHRDPFDRLLVAQALCEDLSIMTADPQICQYSVTVIW